MVKADEVLALATRIKLDNTHWPWGMCVVQALGRLHPGATVGLEHLSDQHVVQMRTWRAIEERLAA